MTQATTVIGSGTATPSAAAADSSASQGGQLAPRDNGAGGLQTEKGTTTIADTVVTKVASVATREIDGVHELGGGTSRAVGSVTQRVGIGSQHSQGVSVEVGEKEAAVDLTIVVEYGESIPKLSQQIRGNVSHRIEAITGLVVTEVNVTVNDLYFPGDDEHSGDESSRVQ